MYKHMYMYMYILSKINLLIHSAQKAIPLHLANSISAHYMYNIIHMCVYTQHSAVAYSYIHDLTIQ